MMKKCTKCGEVKSVELFGRHPKARDGRQSWCKACNNEAARNRVIDLECQNPDCGKNFTANYLKKLCPDCCPKNQNKILALEGKKKCKICDTVRDLNKFSKQKTNSDGLKTRCKLCDSDNAKKQKFNLTCQKENCNTEFVSSNRTAKFCPNCKITKRTKEEIKQDKKQGSKVCRHCQQRKDFSEFYCSKKSPDKRGSTCKQCRKGEGDGRTYNLICQNLDCGVNFVCRFWNRKTCYGCTPKFQFYSDEELKSEMKKYSSRNDFHVNDNSTYAQACGKDWYEDLSQKLWGDPINPGGYKRNRFIEACKRNNDGKGILYLIKCWDKNEMFYKIGITSRSVAQRYAGKWDMPYNYEIIWTIEGDPGKIWGMEKRIIKETKRIRYQPNTRFDGITECFKCHGNCKILREPKLTDKKIVTSKMR